MIDFTIIGQTLSVKQPRLAHGCIGYHNATVTMTGDWNGLTVYAVFKKPNGDLICETPVTNGKITPYNFPSLDAGETLVSFYGVDATGGAATKRATTETVKLTLE